MPANLTPQYLEAEKAFREAETLDDKIRCLEEMLRVIPKHKGTDHLQGDLRRKLSRLRDQQKREQSSSRKGGHSYRVNKEGAGQIALAGAPNAGKSALVDALTNASPEVAEYPFTTRVPQAAMMPFKDVKVQLVDMPAISPEFEENWVVDLLKAADAVALVIDLQGSALEQAEYALEHLAQRRLLPGRAEEVSQADHVPGAVYRPMFVVVNKVDKPEQGEDFEVFRELTGLELPMLPVSASTGRGLEELRAELYELLRVIRVYSKTPGHKPDLEEPYVLPRGSTVLDFAEAVHREMAEHFKYARIWSENKHDGQMVNREEPLCDGDILELHT